MWVRVWFFVVLLGLLPGILCADEGTRSRVLWFPVIPLQSAGPIYEGVGAMTWVVREQFTLDSRWQVLDGQLPVSGKTSSTVQPAESATGAFDVGQVTRLIAMGESQINTGRYGKALINMESALALIERNPSQLLNYDLYGHVCKLLARVYWGKAKQEKALALLEKYFVRRPQGQFVGMSRAEGFEEAVDKVRRLVLAKDTARIRVGGKRVGAMVFVDGQAVGRVPLLIEGVVAGEHTVHVRGARGEVLLAETFQVDSGALYDAWVPVASRPFHAGNDTIEVGLLANRLTAGAAAVLLEQGRLDHADYVLVAGLVLGEAEYVLGAVVGNVETGLWRHLEPIRIDFDLMGRAAAVRHWIDSIQVLSDEWVVGPTLEQDLWLLPQHLHQGDHFDLATSPVARVHLLALLGVDVCAFNGRAEDGKRDPTLCPEPVSLRGNEPVVASKDGEEVLGDQIDFAKLDRQRTDAYGPVVQDDSGAWTDSWIFWTSLGVATVTAGVLTYVLISDESEPTGFVLTAEW